MPVRSFVLAITLGLVSTGASAFACELKPIDPGGDAVATRFIAAPQPRVREAIADAMQAGGVLLFRVSDESVEGERTFERVHALNLQAGDEAIHATLKSSTQDGAAGTLVRVETSRHENKKGVPKHTWSTGILEQAACLVSLLSVDDPLRRPAAPLVDPTEVQVPDSTVIEVRARHFLFDSDLKPSQKIVFETAAPVIVNGSTVIPAGLLVMASVERATDIREGGHGAEGELMFKYLVLPDGTHLPIRAAMDLKGKSVSKGVMVSVIVLSTILTNAGGGASITGAGYAIPAGTELKVQLDGEQKIRVSHIVASAPQPSGFAR
jgi:hypothetical protein